MKKLLFFIAAFLFLYQFSNAQTEKGTQTLGLNLGYSSNNTNSVDINPYDNSTITLSTKTAGLNIGPNYSYFIADNLAIGAALFISGSATINNTANFATTNDSYPAKDNLAQYGGEVFANKYFMFKNKIGLRTGAYIGYEAAKQLITYSPSYSYADFNSKSNYYFGGVYLDFVYYPLKKLGMSARLASLSYEHYKANNTTRGHNEGDGLNFNYINNGLSLSVFYVFGGK
ncbi:MAG: hypothetical protein ACHQIM_11990 [Sphingobacteriales bacterium]